MTTLQGYHSLATITYLMNMVEAHVTLDIFLSFDTKISKSRVN